MTPDDPFDPTPDASAPFIQRMVRQPLVMLVLAVVALVAGIWMSRNTTRAANELAQLPPRADCVRFPGACTDAATLAPPPELVSLAQAVASADSLWRVTLEREARTGAFPDKALTDMRNALATCNAAVADARALLSEAESSGDAAARALALELLTSAYESERALLDRATRLLVEAAE